MEGVPAARISDYEPVSALFKALANPVRAAIVHLLSNRERTVGQLVEESPTKSRRRTRSRG